MEKQDSPNKEPVPESWSESCKVIGELVRTVAQVMREKGAKSFGELGHEFSEEKYNKGMTREQLTRYAAWHVLIGSTPMYELSPLLDFSDEEGSVKDFLEKKLKSL